VVGMDDFLTKPVNGDELRSSVEHWLVAHPRAVPNA